MKKSKYKQAYFLWGVIAIDFVLMFIEREPVFTYFFLAFLGTMFTSLYIIKNKNDISADWQKVCHITFEVGFYLLSAHSAIWLIESILAFLQNFFNK